MRNIIGIYMPAFKYVQENYMAANANIYLHYTSEGFYSEPDRTIYLVTTDSLEQVKEKVSFKSSPNNEDYTFSKVDLNLQEVSPEAKEWIQNRLSSIQQLQNFLEQFRQSNPE